MTRKETAMEEKEVKLKDFTLVKALWPFIRPYAHMLFFTTCLVFLVTFLELLMPLMTQKAIDGFIVPDTVSTQVVFYGIEFPTLANFCFIYACVIAAAFLMDFFQSLVMEYTGQKIILNLRCTLFSHMTQLSVSYFDKNASGRLVSRVAGDVENMNEMFTTVLVFIFKDLMLMGGILLVLFTLNPRLACYLSIIVPIVTICILYFSKVLRKVFRTIRQKIGEINHSFSEGISGIQVIHTTNSKNKFISRFKLLNNSHFEAAMSQIRIFAVFMPFIGFLGILSTALIIWIGSFSVFDKTMTLGELVAFLTYMKIFFRPLRDLSEKFNLLQNALASGERLIQILQQPWEKNTVNPKLESLEKIHDLKFERVSFSYAPDEPVLKEISFYLKTGQSMGIAGQTGSGKSSIINLITGFYHPDSGIIKINDRPHNLINIATIRRRTALVMQDPILFSGTVRENINPGGDNCDDTFLISALEKANCSFLFDKFSGLDTEIFEGGRPFSSGEKQLVCIARAFAFDPDLIIFDEATSYMDSQSEKKVHTAMERLMQGRLSIIIAHRLSTVKNCQTILMLKNGKIIERGSHTELLSMDGEYLKLLQKERIKPNTP